VRDVGGPVDVLSEMVTKISTGDVVGPELFFTGPMLEHSPMHWRQSRRIWAVLKILGKQMQFVERREWKLYRSCKY
jgi:hypothetical protein